MSSDQVLAIIGIIGGGGTILAGMWKVFQMLARIGRRWNHFLDDWFGEPAHGGHDARPGITERLAAVERRTAQLEPNGGGHLSDRVARIEEAVAGVKAQLDVNSEKLDRGWGRRGRTIR